MRYLRLLSLLGAIIFFVSSNLLAQISSNYDGVEFGQKSDWLTPEPGQKFLKEFSSGYLLLEEKYNTKFNVTIYNKELAIVNEVASEIKEFNMYSEILDFVNIGDKYALIVMHKKNCYYAELDQNTLTFKPPVLLNNREMEKFKWKVKVAEDRSSLTLYMKDFFQNSGDNLRPLVYDVNFKEIANLTFNDDLLVSVTPEKIKEEEYWRSKVTDVAYLNTDEVLMTMSIFNKLKDKSSAYSTKKIVLIKMDISNGTSTIHEISSSYENQGGAKILVVNSQEFWVSCFYSNAEKNELGIANYLLDSETLNIKEHVESDRLLDAIFQEKFEGKMAKEEFRFYRLSSYDLDGMRLSKRNIMINNSGELTLIMEGATLFRTSSIMVCTVTQQDVKIQFFDPPANYVLDKKKPLVFENSEHQFQLITNHVPSKRSVNTSNRSAPLAQKEKTDVLTITFEGENATEPQFIVTYDSKGWFVMYPETVLYIGNQLVVAGGDKNGKQLMRLTF